jgi:hypothetical protein
VKAARTFVSLKGQARRFTRNFRGGVCEDEFEVVKLLVRQFLEWGGGSFLPLPPRRNNPYMGGG